MPTTRPRHMLTETDELAAALNDAAVAWPELRGDRGALLRKLVEAGRNSVRNGDGVRALLTDIGDSEQQIHDMRYCEIVLGGIPLHIGDAIRT